MLKIDLYFPKSWNELDNKKLRFVYKLIAAQRNAEYIKIVCLFRWNNISVIKQEPDGSFLVSYKKKKSKRIYFHLYPESIAEVLEAADWIDGFPNYPVRVSKFGWHKALPADFLDVPFEKFLMVENLYQGYLKNRDSTLLESMAYVLYGFSGRLSPWRQIDIFYWFASIKLFFSRKYIDLFQPEKSSDGIGSLAEDPMNAEDRMNAQIRALTKGDVTKEKTVLSLDTWRALTELNALAREYKELNSKIKKQ